MLRIFFLLAFSLVPIFSSAQLTASPVPCSIPVGQSNCDSNPPRIQRTYSTNVAGIKIFLFNRLTNQFVGTLFNSVNNPTRTINVLAYGITAGASNNPPFSARAFTYMWANTGTSSTCVNGTYAYTYTCMRNEGNASVAVTDGDCNLSPKPTGGVACATTPVHVCNEVECGFGTRFCDSNYLGYRSKTFRCSGGCQNLSFYRPVYSTDSDVGSCPSS